MNKMYPRTKSWSREIVFDNVVSNRFAYLSINYWFRMKKKVWRRTINLFFIKSWKHFCFLQSISFCNLTSFSWPCCTNLTLSFLSKDISTMPWFRTIHILRLCTFGLFLTLGRWLRGNDIGLGSVCICFWLNQFHC